MPGRGPYGGVPACPCGMTQFLTAPQGVGGYSRFMFDVLVYLYENYWRPDACPDHDQLSRKLTAAGFENDEIEDALTWLNGLAQATQSHAGTQSANSLRVYTHAEQE